MALPTLRNGGVPTTSTTIPPGLQSGDVLISLLVGSKAVTSMSPAAGWTNHQQTAVGSSLPIGAIYYKLADGSETTVAHTAAGSGASFAVRTWAIVGGTVDYVSGFLATWATGPAVAGASTTIGGNGIVSAARADSMSIILYGSDHTSGAANSMTPPAGWIESSDTTSAILNIETCFRTTPNAYEGIATPSAILANATGKTGHISIMVVLNPLETRSSFPGLI